MIRPCGCGIRPHGQERQKFEHEQSINSISFLIDNKMIITNRGAMQVDNRFSSGNRYPPATTHNFPIMETVMMNRSWIQQGLRDLLWLPHEYRASCNDVHGNTLAIGQRSGRVSFVQLHYCKRFSPTYQQSHPTVASLHPCPVDVG
jgi:hypothetical protein